MIATSENSLTILTVAGPGDRQYVEANIELTALLNRDSQYRVFVLDNGIPFTHERLEIDNDRTTVLEGAPPDASLSRHCRGSYHHAAALNAFLQAGYIDSRYLLIVDPDFYILRKGWIGEVISYMSEKELCFFGAPWHPKWFTKYRYFPCGHCMFIDSRRINVKELDFTPDLVKRSAAKEERIKKQQRNEEEATSRGVPTNDVSQRNMPGLVGKETYWLKVLLQVLSMSAGTLAETYRQEGASVPYGLRSLIIAGRSMKRLICLPRDIRALVKKILKAGMGLSINRRLIGSSNDTGYLIYRSFGRNGEYKYESLLPIVNYQTDFLSPPHLRTSCGRWFEKLFPDRLSFIPKRGTFLVQGNAEKAGYLRENHLQWEEFFWNGKPFGFHMRRFNKTDREPEKEFTYLKSVLSQALEELQVGSRETSNGAVDLKL
jgi:hypothetical protein